MNRTSNSDDEVSIAPASSSFVEQKARIKNHIEASE